MTVSFQVAFDCEDVEKMVKFWQIVMNYKMPDPPPGFASWNDFAEKNNIPKEEWSGMLLDPAGVQPSLYFQPVPEGKTAKNRLHLDIKVSSGPGTPPDTRRQQTAGKVAELIAAGATKLYEVSEHGSFWVTLADPEGNEFCIT